MSNILFSHTRERERLHLLIGATSEDVVQSESRAGVSKPHPLCIKLLPFIGTLCYYAQSSASQLRNIYLYLTALSMVALLFMLCGVWVFSLMFLAAGIGALYLVLDSYAKRRARNFEGDFATLLMSLGSGLKTGLDPLSALCGSKALFTKDAVLTLELTKVEEAINRGDREEQAINNFARSIRYPDIGLFRAAFLLSRKEGSSLGASLERLARVIRQRQSFRRKVRAAVAMQRLSAFGIVICGISISAVQFIAHPQSILETVSSPLGIKLVVAGVSLIIAGLIWMWALVRAEV